MSQENVVIVRRFMEAIERAFDAYWKNHDRSQLCHGEADERLD
jgi:hypothetical protein